MGVLSKISQRKVFYGWWVLVGSTIIDIVWGGIWFYGTGTFFKPLCEEFGWSRASLSLALSLSRAEAGPEAIVVGYSADRWGIRKVMLPGLLIWVLGYLLMARINSLMAFFLVFLGLIGLGAGGGGGNIKYIAVANWFKKKIGRTMGITHSGLCLGGAVFVPLMGWLIANHGWRVCSIACAIVVAVLCLPVVALMRHRPEKYGLLPDGEAPTQVSETPAEVAVEGFTPREALKLPAFWLISIVLGINFAVPGVIVIHQIPYLTDLGFSPIWAATALGFVAGISVTGRVGFGLLADIIPVKYVFAICLVGVCIGLSIFVSIQSTWQIILYIVVYSPFYGGCMIMGLIIRQRYFGRKFYGTITGLGSIVHLIFTLPAPWFAGYVFDVTGSYRIAFLTIMGALLVAAAMVLLIPVPKVPTHLIRENT